MSDPTPLPVCPYTVSTGLQQAAGQVHLVNPGASWLGVPSLPRPIRFLISISLVLEPANAGRHGIRAELTDPDGRRIAENEDGYQVPASFERESGRARMLTIPLEVRLEREGMHRIRVELDGAALEPDWPVEVTIGSA